MSSVSRSASGSAELRRTRRKGIPSVIVKQESRAVEVVTPATAFRGADIVVECLIAAGVHTIFGLPGDTGVTLYDALRARSGRIDHVLARDERHAAVMADAYARVSNRFGVVEVSSGAGVSYVLGALGESFAASVPVLVLTSDINSGSRNTGAITEIDQLAAFAGFTKWRARVDTAFDIPELLGRAISELTSGRPAPAAIIIPMDVLDEVIHIRSLSEFVARRGSFPKSERQQANEGLVAHAVRQLAEARQPVVVAGSGVHLSGAWEALQAFAEQAAIPVATTIHGKGAISDSHPLALGVGGNNGGRPYVNDYLRRADVALLVGTRANATDTSGWSAPDRQRAQILQIDIAGGRAGRNYPGSLSLEGDARAILEQLTAKSPRVGSARRRAREGAVRKRRTEFELAGNDVPLQPEGVLLPRAVLRLMRQLMPPDIRLAADPGTPTPNVAAYWDVPTAGRSVIIPRGHGPMGYAIPAAIGIAHARPGEPVVAITADGSFAMACGELETVARYRLPILFVQFTNHSLGWIKMLQHLYFGRRYFGVDLGPIDAPAVARACGLRATRAQSLRELGEAVSAFLADRIPTYIDIEVPSMIDCQPPVSAWSDTLDGRDGRPVY